VTELSDIVVAHGDEYLAEFGARMPRNHVRALEDIRGCRTESMGGHLEECDECRHRRYSYHSCKNRSCPKCHGKDTLAWLDKREADLLPVRHFHLVFTLPQQLRDPVRSNQKLLYDVLLRSAVYALAKIGLDTRYVGGKLGMLAVLHTWTRALEFHPHVHILVPAGGLDEDGIWRESRKRFLVPVRALSKVFRARFMKLARKALPDLELSTEVWEREWVVFSRPTFNRARKVLRYLGRYVHRIAITNDRIISLVDGTVRFRYRHCDSRQWQTMALPAKEFLRRYLQHVVPKGFHKVRYFGLLSPANRGTLRRLQLLLSERYGPRQEAIPRPKEAPHLCSCCGKGTMLVIELIPRCARSPPAATAK
jgi:hypothetical protein